MDLLCTTLIFDRPCGARESPSLVHFQEQGAGQRLEPRLQGHPLLGHMAMTRTVSVLYTPQHDH
jgi:hypothetical protein